MAIGAGGAAAAGAAGLGGIGRDTLLVAGGADRTVKVWRTGGGRAMQTRRIIFSTDNH